MGLSKEGRRGRGGLYNPLDYTRISRLRGLNTPLNAPLKSNLVAHPLSNHGLVPLEGVFNALFLNEILAMGGERRKDSAPGYIITKNYVRPLSGH